MVRVPKQAQNPMEVDFEVELGIVISRACKNVSVEDAMSYVLGFTVANDISARRWQGKKGGGQWSRSKSFDTFTPLGPCLLVPDECDSLNGSALHLKLKTRVNDIEYQNSNTNDMIFNPAEIVSFISQGTTLEKGTVIITGTPEGVGYTRDPPMFLKDGSDLSFFGASCSQLVRVLVSRSHMSNFGIKQGDARCYLWERKN